MNSETRALLREELSVPDSRLGIMSRERRIASIQEAAAFLSGSYPAEQMVTPLYDLGGGHQVALGKPGKESLLSGDARNEYDMTPLVLMDGQSTDYRPTFEDVFRALQQVGSAAESGAHSALEVLAAMLFRNAFTLDHVLTTDGHWRYNPPQLSLAYVQDNCESIDGIPPTLFLHLIEVLALNEDVKYYFRNQEQLGAVGRQNTLLTCANIALVFLGRVELVDFAYALTRGRGVAPLSQKAARSLLPLLVPPSGEAAIETPVLDAISEMLDMTADDMVARYGATPPSPRNKSLHATVTQQTLEHLLGREAWRTLRGEYNVKCIRVDAQGTPVEDVSFGTSTTNVTHETWSSSGLRRLWARPFLYLVFDSAPPAHARLIGAAFCEIPDTDLEGPVRESWEAAAARLRLGSRDALPRSSESSFFIRNKASQKTVDEFGETTTPLAFWLTRGYVAAMVGQPQARIVGKVTSGAG